jgi:hypothetical protein
MLRSFGLPIFSSKQNKKTVPPNNKRQMLEMTNQNTRSQSMFWGHSTELWDWLGFWLMILGAGLGVLALLSNIRFISSFI